MPSEDTDQNAPIVPVMTPMQNWATAIHELFITLVGVGFTEQQALYITMRVMGTPNGKA